LFLVGLISVIWDKLLLLTRHTFLKIATRSQAIRRLSCCLSRRYVWEILWRRKRGFQESKKIKTLKLRKNLLVPNKKVLIIKFESQKSRESMRLYWRVERGWRGGLSRGIGGKRRHCERKKFHKLVIPCERCEWVEREMEREKRKEKDRCLLYEYYIMQTSIYI